VCRCAASTRRSALAAAGYGGGVFRARRLLVIAYFVIGLVVAAQDGYLENLDNLRRVVSAVLAIVLWPLVLLGFDIRID
jgi:K+-transporting ATPase A subunit